MDERKCSGWWKNWISEVANVVQTGASEYAPFNQQGVLKYDLDGQVVE